MKYATRGSREFMRSDVDESSDGSRYIYNRVVDRLLRLDRVDRRTFLADARSGLRAFPALADRDPRALLRAIAAHDAFNRIAFAFLTKLPGLAKVVARFVPMRGGEAIRRAPSDRPIVFAVMHFGPLYFIVVALARYLGMRRLYVLHGGGPRGHAVARYIRAVGCTPVLTDGGALRKLIAAAKADPSCAVVIAYDYFGARGNREIAFLGGAVPVPTGLALLADECDATVIAMWAELARILPRVVIGGTFGIDRTLEPKTRRRRIMDELFGLLEEQVLARPAEWTEWPILSPERST